MRRRPHEAGGWHVSERSEGRGSRACHALRSSGHATQIVLSWSPARRKPSWLVRVLAWSAVWLGVLTLLVPAAAENPPDPNRPLSIESIELPDGLAAGPKGWTSPSGLSSSLQVMLLLTVLSMAPAILLMTTCFVRIIIVLGFLKQALGTQQLPPSQVITALTLFLTLLIMTPVWKQVYERAVVPYTNHQIGLNEAWEEGSGPIRQFMIKQIERTGNSDDVHLFLDYLHVEPRPTDYAGVPLAALLPAYMLSELKTSFLIGFKIYLPFLIVNLVVAGVMVSMGMLMLPPTLVSIPFKLLLFILLDGWHLVVGMLLQSFQPFN